MRLLVRWCAASASLVGAALLWAGWAAPAAVAQVDGVRPKLPPYTWHEFNRERLALNRRTLAGAYRHVGTRGAWDGDAVRFLDQMAVYFTYGHTSANYRDAEVPTHDQLAEAGRAALAAGCDDPLVAYCLGGVLHDVGKLDEARPLLRKAPQALLDRGYPDARVWAAAHRLVAVDPDSKEGKAAAKLRDAKALRLGCGTLKGVERRERLTWLRQHFGVMKPKDRGAFVEQLRKEPDADPWIADTADGLVHIDLAWEGRGGGWAHTVTDEGWEVFFKHLGLARQRLLRAWQLAPELPEPAAAMISVAMGAGDELDEDAGMWFDRAVAAQLDHHDAYDRMFNKLLPRWGGSHEAMYALGLRGAQTRRFDTDAPWQLVEAVRRIVADGDEGWASAMARPGVYGQLCELTDEYVKFHKAKPPIANWYRTFRAALAWRAGKLDEARRRLDALGPGVLDATAFTALGAGDAWHAASEVFALTGKHREAIKRGEDATAKEKWQAALEAFTLARAALPASPAALPDAAAADPAAAYAEEATRWFVERRLKTVGRRLGLAKGEPVSVQPDATLDGWKQKLGRWHVAADGTLVGAKTDRYTPLLQLQEDVGERYELTGWAAFEGTRRPTLVLIGSGEDGTKYGWVSIFARSVIFHYPGGSKVFRKQDKRKVDFAVRYDKGTVSVRVAGELIVKGFAVPASLHGSPAVGLGAIEGADGDHGTVMFRDLKLRRLGDDVAPLEAKEHAAPAAPKAGEPEPVIEGL